MENMMHDLAEAVNRGDMKLEEVPKPYQKEVGELVEKLREEENGEHEQVVAE